MFEKLSKNRSNFIYFTEKDFKDSAYKIHINIPEDDAMKFTRVLANFLKIRKLSYSENESSKINFKYIKPEVLKDDKSGLERFKKGEQFTIYLPRKINFSASDYDELANFILEIEEIMLDCKNPGLFLKAASLGLTPHVSCRQQWTRQGDIEIPGAYQEAEPDPNDRIKMASLGILKTELNESEFFEQLTKKIQEKSKERCLHFCDKYLSSLDQLKISPELKEMKTHIIEKIQTQYGARSTEKLVSRETITDNELAILQQGNDSNMATFFKYLIFYLTLGNVNIQLPSEHADKIDLRVRELQKTPGL